MNKLYTGKVFPITVDGNKEMYVTNAPYEIITDCFYSSRTIDEFIEGTQEGGYKINKYEPSLRLNFDEK